jgi:acyl-CoA thioesterase I
MSNGSARKASYCGSVAALATLACGSVTPVRPSPAAEVAAPRRIVVLGDSLAVSPSPGRGFPALLQERLDATYPGWVVSNQGIGGDTTRGGLQRLDQALTADTSILVVELGANDGLRGIPIATIEDNLSQIIARARTRGITVLLCGMETPPLNGWDYTLDYHRVFPRLAVRHDVALVPFLLEGVALNPEFTGADGIHPNATGARRIADTVWTYLAPLVASIGSTVQRTAGGVIA